MERQFGRGQKYGKVDELHDPIYCSDSFVLVLSYYANLKEIRYKSTSFNRIVADKFQVAIAV